MLKLYYAPNTCALASHIALEEAGAQYETVRMSFATDDQKKPEYLTINPAAKLAPVGDPFAFARAQEFSSYLCSTVHVAHAHRMRGTRWADDPVAIKEMQRKAPETVGAAFALIEDGMLEGPWVMGKDYSICDAYLFTLAQWLEADGVDLTRLPRVLDHRRRVSERPAVKKAIAQELG